MSPKVFLKSALFRAAGFFKPGRSNVGNVPPEALSYLSKNNPFLKELKERYAKAEKPEHSCWVPWEQTVNLHTFRGENDYVSQSYFRDTFNKYLITASYVESIDDLKLLEQLTEDDLFGVKKWNVLPDKFVTRDLLDSILEIYFLKNTLLLDIKKPIRVLDIGAGYGRLTHRFTSVFPQSHVTCVDAIATSTFLCDFYLKFRKCSSQTQVVPFDQLQTLESGKYDFAMNIHSWSECTLSFVKFWLSLLVDLDIKYLFVVPHFSNFCTTERDGTTGNYEPELLRHGFKPIAHQRKFAKSHVADKWGIYPANYYLFKRD